MKIKYFITLSVLLIAFNQKIYSQNFKYPVTNYSTKEYGRQQEAQNWAVVQDKRGFMYFGNSNGILEFDGKDWNFIKVKSGRYVTSLACNDKGKIFVGSQNEFGYLSPDKLGNLLYSSLSDSLKDDDKFFTTIWKTYTFDDKIYFQSEESLFIYDGKNIKVINATTSFHLSFLVNKTLYLRQRSEGLMKITKGKLEKALNGKFFLDIGIFAMLPFADESENILIASYNSGLWKYNPTNGKIIEFTVDDEKTINSSNIYGGILLNDNNFAFNTTNNGLIIIDKNGKIKNIINQRIGLRTNHIKQAYQDAQRNIWVGLSNGISKIEYASPLSFYSENSGIKGNVYAINNFNNKLYIGTSTGLYKQIPNSSFIKFKPVTAIANDVWSLIKAENSNLIGANDGIYSIENDEVKKIYSINAYTLKYNKKSKLLFVAGDKGLSIFKRNKSWELLKQFDDIFVEVKKIAINKSCTTHYLEIWLGTSTGKALKIQMDSNLNYKISEYGIVDGLEDGPALPFEYQEKVVFATNNGFLDFVDEETVKQALADSLKDKPEFYKGYFDIANIPGNSRITATTLLFENNNRTYFTLDNKINIIDQNGNIIKKAFAAIEMGKLQTIYNLKNKDTWIGCDDGLVYYNFEKNTKFQSNYKTLIRKILIANDSLIFNGTYYSNDTSKALKISSKQANSFKPTLDFKDNSVTFEFASLFFNYPNKIKFSYKLKGYKNKWSSWSSDSKAIFTNLREGDYTFYVKSKNIYATESSIDSFEFTVLPPWHRTTIAYISYFLILIILIYITIKISSYRLRKKNERLEVIIKERTKEIAEEKDKSDKLLLNTLPVKVVDELKEKGKVEPENFNDVTVYFSDVVGFTNKSTKMEPKELIDELSDIFTAFDDIMTKYNCERIKTIGDAYMAVCGMPEPNEKHAENMLMASLEIMEYLKSRNNNKDSKQKWEIRIGLNSGKVTGGIVGVRKYIYDVFGDTINTASRMESSSEPMKINVSEATFNLLKNDFKFINRGKIEAKGKGEINMFFAKLD
ncbi:MAG: adenylate/guanylate cyclase domain-containing protein [Bacteroidota bacterium]|nr:adenylate/guanylate cyclase domain-containing protein [Bacteroidota bacterium]